MDLIYLFLVVGLNVGFALGNDDTLGLTCGENEIHSECTNGGCQARNCSQIGRPIPCVRINPKLCINGCVCQNGYLRASSGECVKEDQCVKVLCGENEMHSECTNGGCQARNCSQIGRPIPCVKINPKFCVKGCVCQNGYLRASSGECVEEDQCVKERCTGPHEYYSCGGACDNVCATLHEQSQTNCPIVNIKCNEMCYCEEGHARDERGECVPIENCHSGPQP